MVKILLKLGAALMLVIMLLSFLGCTNNILNENEIQADATLYAEIDGGEIMERYTFYFDFADKKLFVRENSTIVPLETVEDAKKRNEKETETHSFKKYELSEKQMNEIKDLIQQAKEEKSGDSKKVTPSPAILTIDGKEYTINNFDSDWLDLLRPIIF